MTTTAALFIRDRFTWMAYFIIAFFGYMQGALGPVNPFLRNEFGLSYAVDGLHLSGFSFGIVIAGLLVDRLMQWSSRGRIIWLGSGGMVAGALLFITAATHYLTIPATFIMGLGGGLSVITTQAALVDKYPVQRGVAVAEAMIAVGASAVITPLLVGGLESAGIGWRGAMIAGIVAWLILAITFQNQPVPEAVKKSSSTGNVRLPRLFWYYIAVVVLVAAMQWCMIYWAAGYLDSVVGLETELASAMLSLFFAAIVVGRVLGSRLARHMKTEQLLQYAALAAALGFPIFWLAPVAPLNVIGLFLVGVGMGNLFPMTIVAGISAAPGQTDAASGRLATASGIAIIIIPQILGSLADEVGLKAAYGLVFVLMLLTVVMIQIANRKSARQV